MMRSNGRFPNCPVIRFSFSTNSRTALGALPTWVTGTSPRPLLGLLDRRSLSAIQGRVAPEKPGATHSKIRPLARSVCERPHRHSCNSRCPCNNLRTRASGLWAGILWSQPSCLWRLDRHDRYARLAKHEHDDGREPGRRRELFGWLDAAGIMANGPRRVDATCSSAGGHHDCLRSSG